MKAIKLSILAVMMLTAGITTVKAQTADEIIQKHIDAIGGADNWNKVKTIKMVGSMSQQGMEITMTQTLDLDKGARMDIGVMGMTGFQIITPKGGWVYMPFGQTSAKVDTMKPEMVKMMQKQMDVKGHQLIDYKSAGTKAELAGKDTINNAACFKVKLTDKEGNESTAYFDMKTYHILRTENKVKSDEGEQEVAVAYDNYTKTSEGIVMPMSVSMQGAEIIYKSIEINKPVDAKIFVPALPDAK